MKLEHFTKKNLSRRKFLQAMAGASVASVGGVLSTLHAQAKAPPKRKVPLPKFNVHEVDRTAAALASSNRINSVYADRNGNVHRKTTNGWEKHQQRLETITKHFDHSRPGESTSATGTTAKNEATAA